MNVAILFRRSWNGVTINIRMHLTQKQVKKIIPILQKFVETGEI